ncbi:hypothetical protein F5B22DRAFT_647962 [Xylaria bambusicola]|uniref:uncharacterized protein n=1 Tax=Xylaria bambusicola TaxID=326684 RepID=UPI002008BBE0|nr:uncharacterized protein F5B22DRAFT_647962 [Xylaria bambusicola]KAI0513150.1 hypothetical protein F5B22DRAFT_647962 [Xylaria bambusicola]
MSLSNTSVGVARSSTHFLSSTASSLARVTIPSNATPRSQISSTRSIKAPALTSVTPSQSSLTPIWFNSTNPLFDQPMQGSSSSAQPDSERKVKLGKTLRIIQERLPTLLQSPLPQEILSPNISLHLFPSTHPYLPTVSGRVAYIAALWTSPIAWNRVPIVGNVRLEILSERMVSQPMHFSPRRPGAYGEQLVVKWRTASSSSNTDSSDPKPSLTEQGEQRLDAHLRGSQTASEKKAFTGLFVFEFDKDGRIISHTIEHVDEHGEWEKGVGARVVGLTDWLLGGIKGRGDSGGGLPALCEIASDRHSGKGS